MASITGKVNVAAGAGVATNDAIVTALELEANILTAEKIGVPGANVAREISNGIAGFRVTTEDVAVSDWAAVLNDGTDIDAVDTAVIYDGGTGTQPVTFPFVIVIGTEQLLVTADSGDETNGTLTCARGFDGTTAAIHLDNAAISMAPIAADDITDLYVADAVVSGVTLQTANGESAPA